MTAPKRKSRPALKWRPLAWQVVKEGFTLIVYPGGDWVVHATSENDATYEEGLRGGFGAAERAWRKLTKKGGTK